MDRHRGAALSLIVVTLVLLLPGRGTAQCVPAPTPVLSHSQDDIPRTDTDVLLWDMSYGKLHGNNVISFVEINANEQKVWFSADRVPGAHRTFYNHRYRADANSPWYWEFGVSPVIIETPAPASAGPSTVLYSATPKYVERNTGEAYEYLMLQVYQPGGCDGIVAGFLYELFSHDGVCWTAAEQAVKAAGDGPSFACFPWHFNTVPVEMVTAFDAGNVLYFVGLEGNIAELAPGDPALRNDHMNKTLTYVGWTLPTDPLTIHLGATPLVTNAGMVSPTFASDPANPNRFTPYYYFMNMQMAFDPATGDVFAGRGYPYPYDRQSAGAADPPSTSVTPDSSQGDPVYAYDSRAQGNAIIQGCLGSTAAPLQTYTNRIQIYRMHVISMANLSALAAGPWTLAADWGDDAGYSNTWAGYVAATPLVWPQQSIGADYGSVTFIRDGAGNLIRHNGVAQLLAGDTVALDKSHGQCRVTGTEREHVLQVP